MQLEFLLWQNVFSRNQEEPFLPSKALEYIGVVSKNHGPLMGLGKFLGVNEEGQRGEQMYQNFYEWMIRGASKVNTSPEQVVISFFLNQCNDIQHTDI